jgi:excisionase family DNA binding protein
MDPERPYLRELLTDELWERFLTAIGSLDAAQQRIEALTAEIETLKAARRDRPTLGTDGKLDGIKETAAWTGFSVSWWYAAVAAKRVPYYKVGKYVKFRRAEIEAWLATQHWDPDANGEGG